MVKGYDPSKSDPSKIVLQYLLRWTTSQNPLDLDQALKMTKFWLKNSPTTSSLYQQFTTLTQQQKRLDKIQPPQIKLKKNCQNWTNKLALKMVLTDPSQHADQNFPSYIKDENQIVICLNYITNKTELKESLDRELQFLYSQKKSRMKNDINKEQPIQERDKQLLEHLYQGCKQGYSNYQFQKVTEQRLSKKCSKYLFLRRSQRKLPMDAKFRYTSKLSEQVL